MTLNSAEVTLLIYDDYSSISLFIRKKITIALLYITRVPHHKFCVSIDKYHAKITPNWEIIFADYPKHLIPEIITSVTIRFDTRCKNYFSNLSYEFNC
jgi:hypothetical protein